MMNEAKLNRRAFIAGCGAALAVPSLAKAQFDGKGSVKVRFGVIADCHYANRDERLKGGYEDYVYYRESLVKVRRFVEVMSERKVDFIIELGDFKDRSKTVSETLSKLGEIEKAFVAFAGPHYHVLGNHDTDVLTPAEFLSHISNTGFDQAKSYYSFVRCGFKFIVLDANYDREMQHFSQNNPWKDAQVPPEELEWLKEELSTTKLPVVVFCHERLDPCPRKECQAKNAADVRAVLEGSRKVKAVIMGHSHEEGLCNLNGIRYHSVRALCIGEAKDCCPFAEIAVDADGTVSVTDFSAPVPDL